MKKIMSILAVLCSLVLLGGCANMSQNSEVRATLEKAFNTAQGNDLFEVGKQVLDTYAPSEESVYIVSSYSKGTTKDRNSEALPWIDVVVKFERNKHELKVRLLETKTGEKGASRTMNLVYRGKGQYYMLNGEVYEPLKDVLLTFESKKDITFQSLENQKYRKNEGNNYGLSFGKIDESFTKKVFYKVDSLFSTVGPDDINTREGGFLFSNHKATTDAKQSLYISMTIRSSEKNIISTSVITLDVSDAKSID